MSQCDVMGEKALSAPRQDASESTSGRKSSGRKDDKRLSLTCYVSVLLAAAGKSSFNVRRGFDKRVATVTFRIAQLSAAESGR